MRLRSRVCVFECVCVSEFACVQEDREKERRTEKHGMVKYL